MTWNGLPHDVMDLILFGFSLVEVAQMSGTCKSFKAAYRRLMAAQQRARCEIAFASCGRARITCLLGVIAHLFKGEPLYTGGVDEGWDTCWISADGVLHGPAGSLPSQSGSGPGAGDIHLLVCQNLGMIRAEADVWRLSNAGGALLTRYQAGLFQHDPV
jgi:hypothetical protein